jgi:WD40 repeat protein
MYWLQLWDVYHEGNCLRTFLGHSQAVKDVDFNNSGSKFLSASYDRYIKQWDTETGKCIQVFSNGKIPNVVKYHPDGDKQNIFMAGMQDKKIIQVCHLRGLIWQNLINSTIYDRTKSFRLMINILDLLTRLRLLTRIDDSFRLQMIRRYVDGTTISQWSSSTLPNRTCTRCQQSPSIPVVSTHPHLT